MRRNSRCRALLISFLYFLFWVRDDPRWLATFSLLFEVDFVKIWFDGYTKGD